MVGFPGEDEEAFLETCALLERNGKFISYVNISTLGIEPFTEVYNNRERFRLDFHNSADWSTHDNKNNLRIRNERAARLSHIVDKYVGKSVNFSKPIEI
jgi:tRNA A37 methylthiotransferase MiaB